MVTSEVSILEAEFVQALRVKVTQSKSLKLEVATPNISPTNLSQHWLIVSRVIMAGLTLNSKILRDTLNR